LGVHADFYYHLSSRFAELLICRPFKPRSLLKPCVRDHSNLQHPIIFQCVLDLGHQTFLLPLIPFRFYSVHCKQLTDKGLAFILFTNQENSS
jgi:hypothetical protein